MTSAKQAEANRRNARHSTGPKSASGKQHAAMNALKHGLRAKSIVIPGEDPEEFKALCKNLRVEWQPRGSLEDLLVERLALCTWRLRRIATIEGTIIRGFHLEVCAGAVNHVIDIDEKLSKDEKSKPVLAIYESLNEDRLLSHAFAAADQLLGTLLRYEIALERSLRNNYQELQALQTARKAKQDKPKDIIDVESDHPANATTSPGQPRSHLRRTR